MLDIYDLNFQYCNENYGELYSGEENLPQKGIIIRVLSLLKGIVVHSVLRKSTNSRIESNEILFFTIANNEKKSINPITLNIANSKIFGIDLFENGFPLGKIYWLSLLFIPIVLFRYFFCSDPYHKKSFKYAFDGFCIAYSSHLVLRNYLLRLRPRKIVIANQLSVFHRALALTCDDLDIETVYIQHASITEKFSNLNIFSKILLEGEDSLTKTLLSGTVNRELYLIGVPKFDKYYNDVSKKMVVRSIGICTNGMDDLRCFAELVSILKIKFSSIRLSIRPHPADRRREKWLKMAKKYNCYFSDVFNEDSFDYLKENDLIISGNSNILLEATLLNIPSIYFDPQHEKIDFYGFLKNNLVYYASDLESISKLILEIGLNSVNVRNKAKFFVETVGSCLDGKSTDLATMIIKDEVDYNYFNLYVDELSHNRIFRVK